MMNVLPNPPQLNQLSNSIGSLKSSTQSKINNTKEQIEKRKNEIEQRKKQVENVKENINGFLKNIQKQNIKLLIQNILIPILLRFSRTLSITKLLIKKLKIQTRRQLRNKGKLTINNGIFIFVPNDNVSYENYQKNFNTKVDNIKKSVNILKNVLTNLNNVIRILNTMLNVINAYIIAKQIALKIQLVKITAELASPSPAKPTVGKSLSDIISKLQTLENDKQKLIEIQQSITSAQLFLNKYVVLLNKLINELNNIKFIIRNSNQSYPELDNKLVDLIESAPSDDIYINSIGKSYKLILVTLPNNFKQYQALDTFSGLKITQTAPSATKTETQLFEEIKQILG